jgi:hypothetical protein
VVFVCCGREVKNSVAGGQPHSHSLSGRATYITRRENVSVYSSKASIKKMWE